MDGPEIRVKVCGITLMRDLRLAEACGAEWLGVVVEAVSPRAVRREVAAMLLRAAHKPVAYVVVDRSAAELAALASLRAPAAFQLHGAETPETVAEARRVLPPEVELWQALAPAADGGPEAALDDLLARARAFAEAGAARLVLDARVGARGSEGGRRVDADLAREFAADAPLPCLLAGGLRPKDLRDLWAAVQPFGLDLSSGLEAAPGVKDPAKMRALRSVLVGEEAGQESQA